MEFQKKNFQKLKERLLDADAYLAGKKHRISCIEKFEHIIKKEISGTFIDIGAGTGYFSANLLRKRSCTTGIIVEYPNEAREVIEKCMETFYVDKKRYQIEINDYNGYTPSKKVDYIFAMGSLHHSYALNETMTTIYGNLKEGGYLIAHEPAFSDFYSRKALQTYYQKRLCIDASTKKPNVPRYDFFFRESEYRYVAMSVGFDLISWMRVEKDGFENTESTNADLNSKNTQISILPKSYMMVFQKPNSGVGKWIPHQPFCITNLGR